MSILKSSKTPPATPPEADKQQSIFKAPQIAAKLATAQAALTELERHYRAEVADAVLSADNPDSLVDLECKIVEARALVARLTTAQAGALEADTMLRERHLVEGRKSQLRIVSSHLRIADKAAAAFSTSLAEAIKHYATVVEQRGKAAASASNAVMGWADNGAKLLAGRNTSESDIYTLVIREIARLSGSICGTRNGIAGKCAFPGGDAGKDRLQPMTLPAFAEELRRGSDEIIGQMKAKIGQPADMDEGEVD